MTTAGKRTITTLMLALLGILALVGTALPPQVRAAEVTGYSVWIMDSGMAYRPDDGHLFSIELTTGGTTRIGDVGYRGVTGLTFGPTGTLYGVDDVSDTLITIDPATGIGTAVGALGTDVVSVGLTFDCDGNLWMSELYGSGGGGGEGSGGGHAYRDVTGGTAFHNVDPDTGAATEISPAQGIEGLTAVGDTVVGVGGQPGDAGGDAVFTVDTSTGWGTEVATLNDPKDGEGLATAPDGTLWGVGFTDQPSGTPHTHASFTIDTRTGSATHQTSTGSGEGSFGRFASLAIPGGPACSGGVGTSGVGGAAEANGGSTDLAEPQDAPAAESSTGVGTQPQTDAESPGSSQSSGRSEAPTVADRAPTVEGVGVAGDPDALAGQASDRGAADGWGAALIAALLLGGLVLAGLAGRGRLSRSRS